MYVKLVPSSAVIVLPLPPLVAPDGLSGLGPPLLPVPDVVLWSLWGLTATNHTGSTTTSTTIASAMNATSQTIGRLYHGALLAPFVPVPANASAEPADAVSFVAGTPAAAAASDVFAFIASEEVPKGGMLSDVPSPGVA